MVARGRGAAALAAALGLLLVSGAAAQELRHGSRRLRAVEADLTTNPADLPMFQLVGRCYSLSVEAPFERVRSRARALAANLKYGGRTGRARGD